LADVLFLRQPDILLIDEIDRLSPENVGVLNSLMATGIVCESKVGKTRTMELGTKVFAAGINPRRLPTDLLSRFIALKFQPYTEMEFISVCENTLAREGCSADTARFIGSEVWRMYGTNADIRKAVQIGRLAGGNEVKARGVIKTLKQVGF
jgi:Holliday junction resolvasome RuvABC ATP-dependent DNA helicase subunit